MPADLAVVAIKLPSPLRAPCPVPVLVTVENKGTEAAEPVEFDVTIDLMAGESLFTFFVTLVTQPEDMAISPSRRIIVPVDVEFPCFSPVTLRATVDKQRRVPNNPMPSAPSQTITGLTPAQAPWLKTSLRVGNGDSTGLVTFPDSDGWVHTSPAGWTTFHICPGTAVVAETTVENAGCVMSKASVTEVILEEDVSPMPPIRLGSKQYVVPPLAPGTNHTFAVSLPAPISTAGPSGYLTVRASADTGMANPDQCDRAQLDAAFLSHLDRFGTPLAIQFPDAVVRPGQRPTIAALIENNCSDIGTADLRITYVGAFPTEIYRTQVAIPLQSYADIQIHPGDLKIPTTIANDFWTIGDKPLRLDLTGNGMNGGPYTVSSLLRVIPEPIETFWTWPGLAPSGTWKSSYAFSGTFSNRGSAALILSAFDALEHPTDVIGSTADVTLPAPTGAVGTSVPLGASVPATWLRNQRWAWLVRGTPVEVGPRARIFSYTTSYTVVDEFGNVYPSATSAAMLVRVAVSSVKLFVLGQARELLGIGLVILGGAAAIAFVPVAGWIAGVLLGATAMALIIGATLLLYDADDPPIPDFRRGAPALFDPRNWALPDAEDERLRPLQTVALLVERVVAARVRSVQSRDSAWAAYIDREEVAVTRRREEAHHELETLRRLVQPTIDAADESEELIVQMISEIRSLPSPDELRSMADRFADEIGLEQRERALVEQRLALVDSDDIERAFGQFRANGIRAVGDASRRVYELTAAEFAEREYLR